MKLDKSLFFQKLRQKAGGSTATRLTNEGIR